MTDDELMLTLARECDRLIQDGRNGRANEGRRILDALRNALNEHQSALEEAVRRESRAQAPDAKAVDSVALALVKAVLREWRLVVNDSRAHAVRFVEAAV